MPEEGKSREDLNGADRSRERSFDELAKGLANNSVSRRDALKLVGTALAGGVLASIPGIAWAQQAPSTGAPPTGVGGGPPSGFGGGPPTNPGPPATGAG